MWYRRKGGWLPPAILFCSFPPPLSGFSTLCFNEEATTVSKTVKLGFDLKGKQGQGTVCGQ